MNNVRTSPVVAAFINTEVKPNNLATAMKNKTSQPKAGTDETYPSTTPTQISKPK
jgi:hypothetical protein